MSGTLELGYDYTNNITRAVSVDATGKLEVVSSGGGGGGGDASAANQVLQLAQETTTATETTSINTKITTGEDDSLLTAQQVLIYGRKDDSPTGLRAIKVVDNGAVNTNDGGLNGKITTGSDATLTTAQQTVVYGRDSGGGLDALKVDNQGHLEVVLDAEQLSATIFSGTQVIASSASHTFTTALDKNGSSQFSLLLSSSTAVLDIDYNVNIEVSDDDITYYTQFVPLANTVQGIQNVEVSFSSITPRYVKVIVENIGVASLTITSVKATRINGL